MQRSVRNTILTSLGSALEYYDFVTYIMLSPFIARVFFQHQDHWIGLMITLTIFAIGYIVRPLGGMLFGSYADRLGRKNTFLLAITLMGISTLMIGLLPSYQTIGSISIILLLLLRILQGISQGAELPGAITMITEFLSPKNRGFGCGLLMMNVGFGAMLSSLINFMLTHFLSPTEIIQFGWRIPFILGGLLAAIAFYARTKTEETPVFLKAGPNYQRTPLRVLLTSALKPIILGIGICLFPASFIIFGLFIPSYATSYFHYQTPQVYLALTVGLLCCSLALPFTGILSDKVGRKKQMLMTCFVTVVIIYNLFNLLNYHHVWALYTFVILYELIIALLGCCYPAILSELFATQVRYSGIGTSYNIAFTIAGTVPFIATLILHYSHNPLSITLFFAILALLSLTSLLTIEGTRQNKPLQDIVTVRK